MSAKLRRWLIVGVTMVGIAVVPALLALFYVAFMLWVPRYSAVAYFYDRFGFNLRLDLYRTDPGSRDSGRSLSVITSSDYHTFDIPAWDWQHKARTSVYRLDDNHLAVLSAMGSDYRITLSPFAYAPTVSDSGEQWQYLGAFEFTFPANGRPHLQFFDGSELAECIPMGAEPPSEWTGKARPQARQASCPTVHTEE